MNLYVYFKFVVSDHPQVLKHVRDMHNQLSMEFPGLACSLLKRPLADQDGKETWMEVYCGPATEKPEFKERLAELVSKNNLPEPRRNEVFISID